METTQKTKIAVSANINAGIDKTWMLWNGPEHITQWNAASPEWHTPKADNDLREGGKFSYRMEAKDGSFGFDFEGIYDEVIPSQKICYSLSDGRKVEISFIEKGDNTEVTETFDADDSHSIELQQTGWQAILDNFKRYVESH